MKSNMMIVLGLIAVAAGCTTSAQQSSLVSPATSAIKPVIITEPVKFDSDDPAIWIDPSDSTHIIILGTDKNEQGALYAFNLQGKIIPGGIVEGLKRPNNVDIGYGLVIGGKPVDIAVVTERMTHKLRIFSLPELKPLDHGGIEVFQGETQPEYRDLMGIAIYKSFVTNELYAIVGRKSGPLDGSYLWQYILKDDGQGGIKAECVRKFGKYSGNKEIEAIAVDEELGYVYYADEGVGIRKYFADPAKGNDELALFGQKDFTQDHEGISIYKSSLTTGYILVSDQQAHRFNVYPREGSAGNPHAHPLMASIPVAAQESDGSEVTSRTLPAPFQSGLFVAMSDDKTFHFYRWQDIAGKNLKIASVQPDREQ
jgi:3-phytase